MNGLYTFKFATALSCLLLLCGGVSAFGEDEETTHSSPWSLKECIDYAVEHNISVKQSSITVEQRETELITAKGKRLPGVSASASENFSFGRGLTSDNTYTNSNTTSTSFSLGADLPIFDGFSINYGIKTSQLDLDAALSDLEKARDDVRVSVAQAYVEILYAKEVLKVAEYQASHDEDLLHQIEAKSEVGKASSAEVSAQRATLARSRLSLTEARNSLNLALLDLTQLLELSSPEGFDVEIPSEDLLSSQDVLLASPQMVYEEALGFKPAIRSAYLRAESAKVSIDAAKGAYLPSLSLSGGLGTNYYTASSMPSSSFSDQIKNNFSQYVGLSMSIPIFSRFSTRNSVKGAQLSYNNSLLQLESEKKALYKEIQQAYYNAVAAQARLESSSESASSAEEHYALTEQKYLNGKAGITDYNDAKNSYLQAESNYLKAVYECLFQTKLLDFYRGVELSF